MTGWELLGGGSGFVALVTLFIGSMRRKQGVVQCKREHEHVAGKFKSGNERFNKLERADVNILEVLRKHSNSLGRVEGTLSILATKNGFEHKTEDDGS